MNYLTPAQQAFLNSVRDWAKTNPEFAPLVSNYASDGVHAAMSESRAHAIDMETVAAMALNTRIYKDNKRFIADKLETWKHRSGLRMDDLIAELRK